MLKTSVFVKTVPQAVRSRLPSELQGFKVTLMPWLVQLYYDDKLLHYELVKLPTKYGDNRIEIGLHFESKNRALNEALLTGFDRYLFEIRDRLGDGWWAEPWDRGWTKVYTTLHYQTMDEPLLEQAADQLAQAMIVMQPIYHLIRHRWKG